MSDFTPQDSAHPDSATAAAVALLEERKQRRRRIERRAGNVALWILVTPMRSMPMPAARLLGSGLGAIVYRAFGRYRRAALKNLALVYGAETSAAERVKMARAVFRHFGQAAAEFLQLPRLDKARVDSLVTVEGEENLRAAQASGKGILLITGHFGNWELMARWLTTHGYVLNVVARDARSPQTTKLMEETRQGSGANVLYRGNSARAVLQCLRRNEIVGLLPDQNAADVFVPFFGYPTGTVDGPAVLHLKLGAPLLFSWCIRLPDNRFRIVFESPETLTPTGDRDADNVRVMTLINSRLEAQIRQNPTQWLWLHDRWKASPGVFPDAEDTEDNIKRVRRPVKPFWEEEQADQMGNKAVERPGKTGLGS